MPLMKFYTRVGLLLVGAALAFDTGQNYGAGWGYGVARDYGAIPDYSAGQGYGAAQSYGAGRGYAVATPQGFAQATGADGRASSQDSLGGPGLGLGPSAASPLIETSQLYPTVPSSSIEQQGSSLLQGMALSSGGYDQTSRGESMVEQRGALVLQGSAAGSGNTRTLPDGEGEQASFSLPQGMATGGGYGPVLGEQRDSSLPQGMVAGGGYGPLQLGGFTGEQRSSPLLQGRATAGGYGQAPQSASIGELPPAIATSGSYGEALLGGSMGDQRSQFPLQGMETGGVFGQAQGMTSEQYAAHYPAGPEARSSYGQDHYASLARVVSQPAAGSQCQCMAPQTGGLAQVGQIESGQCLASRMSVRQELAGSGGGLSLEEVSRAYQLRQRSVTMASVSATSFMCMDDRVAEPTLATPGADLGEFILGLSTYLLERDGPGAAPPRQEVIDAFLLKYLKTLPPSRTMVHCTDDRAVRHLEEELQVENLDLQRPPERAKQAGLLEKLTEVENHGDSHIRLMLKQPDWYQVDPRLVPMVLKAFYTHLWNQTQDTSSDLHQSPKLRLVVLVGQSDPEAFIEVSSGEPCQRDGMAPMLVPHEAGHAVLVSHLDAVSLRRKELASFFARISNATPRKIDRESLRQLLDRHGWFALETTGRRVAGGLPFFTLGYG